MGQGLFTYCKSNHAVDPVYIDDTRVSYVVDTHISDQVNFSSCNDLAQRLKNCTSNSWSTLPSSSSSLPISILVCTSNPIPIDPQNRRRSRPKSLTNHLCRVRFCLSPTILHQLKNQADAVSKQTTKRNGSELIQNPIHRDALYVPEVRVFASKTNLRARNQLTKIFQTQINSTCATPFGLGVITELRKNDGISVVALDWGANTKAYIPIGDLRPAPLPGVGSRVSTTYGDGMLIETRRDGFVIAKLDFQAIAALRFNQVRPIRAYPFGHPLFFKLTARNHDHSKAKSLVRNSQFLYRGCGDSGDLASSPMWAGPFSMSS